MEVGRRGTHPRAPRPAWNGVLVFGPLPQLHRLLLVAAALLVGIASGAWVAHFTPLPVAASVGALVGAVAGVLLAYALVHDFHARARPLRVRRH
ncbi:hypothetical protein GCM10009844_25940 [Nocardioides koreensis]|uniref:Uncharacterized protein n=1 Tax=Nocardioides koreensis TaxID=433651 RepID=A0ABN2ZUU4_9ACTN